MRNFKTNLWDERVYGVETSSVTIITSCMGLKSGLEIIRVLEKSQKKRNKFSRIVKTCTILGKMREACAIHPSASRHDKVCIGICFCFNLFACCLFTCINIFKLL